MLPNPSFEDAGRTGLTGWQQRAWHGAAQAEWLVAAPGHHGKQCVSIRSTQGADAAWWTTVAVQPHTFYRLSGWIRTAGVRGAVGALLNLQNMQHVRTARVRGDHDWTHVATLFRTEQETAVEINCLFGGWGDSTGQAWYDEITLERLADGATTASALVNIATRQATHANNPLLRGGFIEHFDGQVYGGIYEPGSPLADDRGFRSDVLAALRELKLSVVRWPGGCFASGYHWRDGVGPRRRPVADPVWGTVDPNTFGTLEFVEWCRRVGCEPYVCTNAGNGSVEEMRDWLAYCNQADGPAAAQRRADGHAAPLGVRYWSIGNENWGAHEIGARTPAEWGPLVLRAAEALRAVDPTITLLAAATADAGWTQPLLATAGRQLNQVAIHEYWLPCWGENLTPDYATCITLSEGPERTLSQVIGLLDDSGQRGRITIAFDEWNLRGWHHPGFPRKQVTDPKDAAAADLIGQRAKNAIASQYTLADALFTASFLNACLRHAPDVGMACIAPMVNTRGPLFVHPGGLVKRTTFHVLAMYANLLEARVAEAETASAPFSHAGRTVATLDALATCDASGQRWRLALVNRHPSEPLRCTVSFDGLPLVGRLRATVLAGDSPEADNDVDRPDRVVPATTELDLSQGWVELSPHSLTILEVDRRPAD